MEHIYEFIQTEVDFYFSQVGTHIKDLSKEEMSTHLRDLVNKKAQSIDKLDQTELITKFTDRHVNSIMMMIEALLILDRIKSVESALTGAKKRTTKSMH